MSKNSKIFLSDIKTTIIGAICTIIASGGTWAASHLFGVNTIPNIKQQIININGVRNNIKHQFNKKNVIIKPNKTKNSVNHKSIQ